MSTPLFDTLKADLSVPREAKKRVSRRIEEHISRVTILGGVRASLQVDQDMKKRVWGRVLHSINVGTSLEFLQRIRTLLTPSADLSLHLRAKIFPQFTPAHVRVVYKHQRGLKWVASLMLFVLLVKAGPQLFLAPQTVADSRILLMPTRGVVSVSVGGLWQPVDREIALEPGTLLRTHAGEASIVLRDDGVIRLDAHTTVKLDDTSDPVSIREQEEAKSTLTLYTGRIWVQGLIPSHLHGIDIATTYGNIVVHEGSVSVAEDETVDVAVWDRRTQLLSRDSDIYLVAGERTSLSENNTLIVKKLPEEGYENSWVAQNLSRDAVHRRSIAQLQQERRVARAGILPTSKLYPLKRIAETVSTYSTFGEEARVAKQLQHASSRLDEAAALLAEGETEAVIVPLEDYRDSLIALAGDNDNLLVQSLIQQSLVEESAEVSAMLPDEKVYLIKEAVLEANAALPEGTVNTADVQGVLLVDTVSTLLQRVDEGSIADVADAWEGLQEHLAVLNDDESDLRPEVIKEAKVILSELAFAVNNVQAETATANAALLEELQQYFPAEISETPVLTEEELMAIVQNIKDRIFVYHMARSRVNQLVVEMRVLAGHPDQGSILRRLYFALPGGPDELPERVRKEIVRIQWQNAADLL